MYFFPNFYFNPQFNIIKRQCICQNSLGKYVKKFVRIMYLVYFLEFCNNNPGHKNTCSTYWVKLIQMGKKYILRNAWKQQCQNWLPKSMLPILSVKGQLAFSDHHLYKHHIIIIIAFPLFVAKKPRKIKNVKIYHHLSKHQNVSIV